MCGNVLGKSFGALSLATLGFGVMLVSAVQAREDLGVDGFRGPLGNGVFGPVSSGKIDAKAVVWKQPISGAGWAAPIVQGNKVFIATVTSPKLETPKGFDAGVMDMRPYMGGGKPPKEVHTWKVMGLDHSTGKILWETPVAEAPPQIPHHASNTYATETPASDGKTVGVWFGSAGIAAGIDAQSGKILWKKDLGVQPRSSGFGTGSSPVTDGKRLFIQNDNDKASFLIAFDLVSGKELWKVDRPKGTSWSTPLLWRQGKRTDLVACGSGMVTGYDPETGKETWKYGGFSGGFACSPACDEKCIYFGNSGPGMPGMLVAIRAGAQGDLTPKKEGEPPAALAWSKKGNGPGLASPVSALGRLFVSSQSFLACYDAETGKQLWRERLNGAKSVVSSVWATGDLIMVIDEAGNLFVVRNSPTFEMVQKVPFGELYWSTPTLSGNRLYLRSAAGLISLKME